jgi:hypothetical protein
MKVLPKKNKPTLDRKNNKIGHTKANVYPCCCYCNRVKSNHCKNDTKLFIQLKKYATKMNLPFTFAEGDEEEYEITRKNITSGLSNVHNRRNLKGYDTIKQLKYVDNKINIIDTKNKITHIIRIDFSSLYPSSYSSIPHPFNPYTDGIMYMPGRLKKLSKI